MAMLARAMLTGMAQQLTRLFPLRAAQEDRLERSASAGAQLVGDPGFFGAANETDAEAP